VRPWLILREGERRRWGGDLRRRYVYEELVRATGGTSQEDRRPGPVRRELLRLRGPRWQVWRRRAYVASSEVLPDDHLEVLRRHGVPAVIDIHDEPVLQAEALGVPFDAAAADDLRRRIDANVAMFRFASAPAATFASLADLDPARTVIAPNGTDTTVIRVEPWPATPAIGFISGAAPNRGIEDLIGAARLLAADIPELRLLLWLAATGEASQAYLDRLRSLHAGEPWIEFGSAAYGELSPQLGRATILAIPTPAHPYWDSVPPLKLFDAMAAGRPTVASPRTEIRAVVEEHDAGRIAAGDGAQALAAAMAPVLADPELARRLGLNARQAAEDHYDWRVLGRRFALDLLDRLRA
jgi:glycosyltransferase involved in cell wall biosynthesis